MVCMHQLRLLSQQISEQWETVLKLMNLYIIWHISFNLKCAVQLERLYFYIILYNCRCKTRSKEALGVNSFFFVNLIWLIPLNVPFVTLYLINVLPIEKKKIS